MSLKGLPKFFQPASNLVRVNGVNLFSVIYCRENHIPYVAARYIKDYDHPITPKIVHMYQNREQGILWWTVVIGALITRKSVVRSYYARRIKVAFRTALKERGYDAAGRRVVRDKEGNVVEKVKVLKGTMELRMGLGLMNSTPDSVLEQARCLVKWLEEDSGKSRVSRPTRKKDATRRVDEKRPRQAKNQVKQQMKKRDNGAQKQPGKAAAPLGKKT